MGLGNIVSMIKSYYDKLITFVILVGLLASLVYLGVRIGLMQREQKRFANEINSIPVQHEHVAVVSAEPVDKAEKRLKEPFQAPLQKWTAAMFVPESRVRCVDCRKPIPYSALKCPICQAHQPDDPKGPAPGTIDTDKDGIPDDWEKKFGLDAFDVSDATKDNDGDGFSNLIEFHSDTDPKNTDSHPTWESALRVDEVKRDPFNLKFKGHVKMANGERQFQLNLRGEVKTYFVKMNGEVEGFKVVKYEPKVEESEDSTTGKKRKVDVSVLTLKRAAKLIPLVKNKEVLWNEFTATIVWELDGSSQSVGQGGSFELKLKDQKQKYTANKIDMTEQTVVLHRADGQEFIIRKTLASESKETSEKN